MADALCLALLERRMQGFSLDIATHVARWLRCPYPLGCAWPTTVPCARRRRGRAGEQALGRRKTPLCLCSTVGSVRLCCALFSCAKGLLRVCNIGPQRETLATSAPARLL